ncbi:hypothetical protein ACQP1U_02105 [Actinomycetota bacterium]
MALMDIDKTPLTEFGWFRASLYMAATIAIWLVLMGVTRLVADWQDWSWVTAGFPGIPLAIACGVAWEYTRRDRARKRR